MRSKKIDLLFRVAQVLEFDTLTVEQRQSLTRKYWQYYANTHGGIPDLKLLCLEASLKPNQSKLFVYTDIPTTVMDLLKDKFSQLPLKDTLVGAKQLMRFNSIFKEEKYTETASPANPIDDGVLDEPSAKRPKLN